MLKFRLTLGLLALNLLSLPFLYSQTASFSTWKDNKKAAYTIIHDDFGDFVTSIYDQAYPLATARGVRFSFGAITSACGPTEWTRAKTMIAAGHECINHSHNHKCGGPASDCIGSPTYGVADFSTELDLSTRLIETNTGVRPLFFIHPFDSYTQTVLDYLKNNLGYIGSRAGASGEVNPANFNNFMRTNFFGFDNSPDAIASLKNSVDEAITAGGYLVRELHGIDDASFGAISRANYITHLNYVKTKADANLLWAAPASEVLTYKIQRDGFTIGTVYNPTAGTINVNFTRTAAPLNTAQLRTPVTVNVNLGTIAGTFTATQGTTAVTTTRTGAVVSFNVYPHQGNVVLKSATTAQLPVNIIGFSAAPESAAVDLSWTNPTSNFDEVMIVAKATTPFTTQPTGTVYTANSNFPGAATAFEGGKVVYRGTGTGVTVTGLTNGTLYHFKAFSRLGTLWSSGVALSSTPNSAVVNPIEGCLKAAYFSNINLSGTPVIERPENKIDYNWGTNAPISGLPANRFSVRWQGTINPPLTGAYVFTATTDDGVRLWINNVLVIDRWVDRASTANTATVNLAQGQPISMRMEYYENSGNASAKLEWKIPTVAAKRVIAFDACPLGSVFNAALCYRVMARHSNKVMALTTNSNVNGVAIVQNTWTGTREQVWRIKQIDATYYQLTNGFSGKAGTIQNASTAELAPIVQSNYLGTTNQQFKFDRNTEGYYTITARNSNRVLDVTGGSLADKAAIIQYRSNAAANQQWRVESVGCPTGTAALATNRVVAFNGYLENQKGILQWVVNSDDLNDYYDLEKMDANQNFTRLTSINGNSADALRSFNFTDDKLEDGENVYRVKAIDKDGSVQFSNLVTIKYEEPNTYALSPNPTQDYVDINLTACENRPVVLTIMDALGHKIHSIALDKAGKTHRIEFGDIATGQYMLHIQAAGKRAATRVIIVSK
jgi:hypothetical protein